MTMKAPRRRDTRESIDPRTDAFRVVQRVCRIAAAC
jgi:hypothetical protein